MTKATTPPTPSGPLALAMQALQAGFSPDQAERLAQQQIEHDGQAARIAFAEAMVEFKRNPPKIVKDVEGTDWDYASIGHVVEAITQHAAAHGFSHRWIPSKGDQGQEVIECEVTHVGGHSQRTRLEGMPDETAGTNLQHAARSIDTQLSRYSLLLAYGLAVKNQPDDDARSASGMSKLMADWLVTVANASTLPGLSKIRREGARAFADAGDVASWNKVLQSIDKRTNELKGLPA